MGSVRRSGGGRPLAEEMKGKSRAVAQCPSSFSMRTAPRMAPAESVAAWNSRLWGGSEEMTVHSTSFMFMLLVNNSVSVIPEK